MTAPIALRRIGPAALGALRRHDYERFLELMEHAEIIEEGPDMILGAAYPSIKGSRAFTCQVCLVQTCHLSPSAQELQEQTGAKVACVNCVLAIAQEIRARHPRPKPPTITPSEPQQHPRIQEP